MFQEAVLKAGSSVFNNGGKFMGNRAIIQTKESYENEGIGIYLHWNGGRDSVEAFLKYCELKGYRSPDCDNYGWARLCQVIGNYFGGALSIGIDNFGKSVGEWQDNGTYIIKGWKIVDRKCWGDDCEEQNNYDLTRMLIDIDKAQPVKEQFGKDFILAPEVPISKLKIGDTVFINIYEGTYEKCKVVGIKDDIPYVDLYDHDGDYSWNSNNYIRTETIKVCR